MIWSAGVLALALLGAAQTQTPSASAPPSASAAPVDLASFGRLPSLENVEISPDGKLLAMEVGDESHRQVQVRDRFTHQVLRAMDSHNAKVREIQWAGPNHLLITTSTTTEAWGVIGPRQEYLQALDIDLVRKRTTALMDNGRHKFDNRALNVVRAAPVVRMIDGHPVVFLLGESFPDHRGVATLYRDELDTDSVRQLLIGDPATRGWLIDAKGQPAARVDYEQAGGRWSLRLHNADGWKIAYSEIAPLDGPSALGFSPDGLGVLVSTTAGGQRRTRAFALATGQASEPLETYARLPLIIDDRDNTPLGHRTEGLMQTRYEFFNSKERNAWAAIVKAFPGEDVQLLSWSDDRRQVAVSVEGPVNGAGVFLVDLTTGHADWLGDEYGGIGPGETAERRAITYDAADGTRIRAYLTLPRGRAVKDLPLVVLAHGGPAARDAPGFDWWSQGLASRGYAVLQPQFRGSAGFSPALLAAGYGQWGRKMQTDLSDGVRALAKQGTIDPKRVCIVGASYGGYAALAGAALDTGVYRCAASLAGPSDLRRMLAWEMDRHQGARNATLRYWDRFMGASSPNDPALDAISPARHAEAVTIPVLLIHGQDDTVVAYEQSRIMADALKRAGKPVEFITLKGEDHWLSRSETRLQMLQAMAAFLEKNNPPG